MPPWSVETTINALLSLLPDLPLDLLSQVNLLLQVSILRRPSQIYNKMLIETIKS